MVYGNVYWSFDFLLLTFCDLCKRYVYDSDSCF